MTTMQPIETEYAALLARLTAADHRPSAADSAACETFARKALQAGHARRAAALLEQAVAHAPEAAGLWQLLGISWRELQETEKAWAALTRAAALAPQDPALALALAQISFETWRPAAALFQHAQHLAPDDQIITRNTAAALVAEGRPAEAQALLAEKLVAHPGWLDGHKALASLRMTTQTTDQASGAFAASYEQACRAQPQNLALRLAWFQAMAQARAWEAARDIIRHGESLFPGQPALAAARVFIESESGAAAADPHLFDSVAKVQDIGLDLCRVRHFLRCGDSAQAEGISIRYIGTQAASAFWPYLSLAWRLQQDARADWLDRGDDFIKTYDLALSAADLDLLAQTLRDMHIFQAPYLEQSVRGGTQTDRHLFFNTNPAIQSLKRQITKAVRAYVDDLPPHDAAHPLLAPARDSILFEGSWSVRLKSAGYHVCHTHPKGWISSAFYVSLPGPRQMGSPPAGWIRFGTAPPALALPLHAYAQIEPRPGRLVLFPSTMWHGTLPFDDGERLTVAFDVRRPKG